MDLEINNLTIILICVVFLILSLLIINNLNATNAKKQKNMVTNNRLLQNNNKTNNLDTFNNTTTRYNEITYGMNPECLKSRASSKFCPNAHPNIPCSLVANCNGATNPNLTEEMKRDIYMYVYLTGLLETSDIFNADKDHYWYDYTINNTTTTTAPVSV